MGNDSRRTLRGLELRCPPLPQTLLEALALIDRPEKMEVGPVTEMVQRDPIVVARLLHTVNSAYYGLRHTISSAERAVVMLGPVAVAGIVVGMYMLKLRSVLEGPAGDCFRRLIRHSIASAFLARHLTEGTPRDENRTRKRGAARIGVAFTAGLLHDFGKIILIYNYQEEATQLYAERALTDQVSAEDDRELEQLLFGCDHAEAGEYAARKLNFPDVLTDVIRHHHEPLVSTGDQDRDRVIRACAAANRVAKAMGYAFNKEVAPEDLPGDPIFLPLVAADPRFETAGDLVANLFAQKDYLDDYVQRLTSRDTESLDPEQLAARTQIWKLRP